MKIAILRADTVRPEFAAQYGEYPDMFMALLRQVDPGLEFITYDVEHGEYPESVAGIDAWLITGSKASVYDDEPWIHRLEDFVRQLHQAKQVIIGICFGHQMVARALGGKTEKAAVGWGVGVHSASWRQRPAWLQTSEPGFNLLVSHQDQVTAPAPGSDVLAGSEFCPNAVIQLGDSILTFQGHPEFTPPYSRDLMNFRREKIGEAVYQRGIQSLDETINGVDAAHWIIDFIKARKKP